MPTPRVIVWMKRGLIDTCQCFTTQMKTWSSFFLPTSLYVCIIRNIKKRNDYALWVMYVYGLRSMYTILRDSAWMTDRCWDSIKIDTSRVDDRLWTKEYCTGYKYGCTGSYSVLFLSSFTFNTKTLTINNSFIVDIFPLLFFVFSFFTCHQYRVPLLSLPFSMVILFQLFY